MRPPTKSRSSGLTSLTDASRPRCSMVHRERVGRIWIAEAPDQVNFVRAQLGVGTWANGIVAPYGWGNIGRGRIHRSKHLWIPEEFEAANDRNGFGRS